MLMQAQPTPAVQSLADLHPGETCDHCGKSLMRCGYCGFYADEHLTGQPEYGCGCDCAPEDREWYRVDGFTVETHKATHWEPAEHETYCHRCGGGTSDEEDGDDRNE